MPYVSDFLHYHIPQYVQLPIGCCVAAYKRNVIFQCGVYPPIEKNVPAPVPAK